VQQQHQQQHPTCSALVVAVVECTSPYAIITRKNTRGPRGLLLVTGRKNKKGGKKVKLLATNSANIMCSKCKCHLCAEHGARATTAATTVAQVLQHLRNVCCQWSGTSTASTTRTRSKNHLPTLHE